MIVHKLNPTIINLGFLEIRWYSVFYLIGLAIAYLFIKKFGPKKGIKLTHNELMDYIVYLAVGLLIGGRLAYFIFYNPSQLLSDPIELIRLWNGGMSFHGGFIGAFVGGWLFARKHKIDTLVLADLSMLPLTLGLALGRIGNFINGELYGRVWDGALCIDYSQNTHLVGASGRCRFPSQFVESAKNLLMFFVLFFMNQKKFKKGTITYAFITMYGALRFLVEFIREPDPQLGFVLGPFTMGQVLSTVMFLIGCTLLVRNYWKDF